MVEIRRYAWDHAPAFDLTDHPDDFHEENEDWKGGRRRLGYNTTTSVQTPEGTVIIIYHYSDDGELVGITVIMPGGAADTFMGPP